DVNIEAGSGSFYAYKTITFDRGANVNVMSTPVSTADAAKILYCNKLAIMSGIERVHIGCKRYIAGDVIYTKEDYVSVLGAGVTVTIGSFENGCFAGAADPNYNNWPAFEAVGGEIPFLPGVVDGNGEVNANDALLILRYSLGLISSLPYPEAADVDGNGAINANDALLVLRFSLGLIDHFPAE
ncbi:MAG: dockerin type I repeat-containing protein, partial [Clostridia bacterium]|nr:dockerin type I repeat-containing protein [Clostridia bacterium]